MDGEAWWATVHGVTRVRHDLETKSPPPQHSIAYVLRKQNKGMQNNLNK